jgi:type I restriction enzyme S subunit
VLTSKIFEDFLAKLQSGSTIVHLYQKDFINFNFLAPEKPEQQAIATILSDTDALIEGLENLIAKKRAIKQGVMQELLTGNRRLPGFSGKWEAKKVSDFGEVITGSTPSTKIKDYWGGDIPWVTPTDITDKKDICNSEREITPAGLAVIRKLPKNSLLVTCIASIGKNVILRRAGTCNQQINAIVPSKEYDVVFLYYLFEGKKQYLLGHAGMTATNIISKKDFLEILFSIPHLLEQIAIAAILTDMDAEISELEQKLAKYQLVKQGMMQILLTGKVRLV